MKQIAFLFLVFYSVKMNGQVLKFNSGVGFSITTGSSFKKVTLAKNVFIGTEFILKPSIYIDVMTGISTLHYSMDNIDGEKIYTRKQFACLSILLKKYYALSKSSSFFWEVGPGFNYDFNTLQESYTVTSVLNTAEKNLGSIINLNGSAGFKTQITKNVSFDASIYSQSDLFTFYKAKTKKIKTDRQLLSFTLYFKLKK